MPVDDFLGHPGGSSPGHQVALLVCSVVVLEGLDEVEGHAERP